MLPQLATWAIVFIALLSIGSGALHAASAIGGVRRAFALDAFDLAWLGLALLIAFLELASLVGPIGGCCVAIVAGASVPGLLLLRPRCRRVARWRALVAAMLAVVAALVVAHAANRPVSLGDTCATHIQQVMWARDHGAVVGLGNLSVKLALDQSAHLFAALLDRGPWRDNSIRVTVPFFLWLTLAQWAATVVRSTRTAGDGRARIYCALTLPFLLAKLRGNELPSLSGDLTMACAALTMMRALLRLPFVERRRLRTVLARHAYEAWLIGALGALVATLKLSGALCVPLGAAIFLASARTLRRRWLIATSAVPLALLGGMIGRRVVLSGWLLFPAPIGDLHLPWSLPDSVALGEYRYIRAWARLQMRPTADVLDHGFGAWFGPWLETFAQSSELRLLVVALVIAIARASTPLRRRLPLAPLELGAFATTALSLAYWFAGAPDVRFGAVFFWMLLATAVAPIAVAWDRRGVIAVIVLLGGASLLIAPRNDTRSWQPQRRDPSWLHVVPVDVHYQTEPRLIADPRGPPLLLNVPRWGRMFCGDTPLPCTPYPGIQRLREAGRLASGFLPVETRH